MASSPIIGPTARRHGVSYEDMLHACRQPIRIWDVGEGMRMYIGPDLSSRFLEVGVVTGDDGIPVIVHAMAARAKFLR